MSSISEKLHQEFLSCDVCVRVFNDPCTLACQHTFCRDCVVKCTKSRQNAQREKCIICPKCRQETKVPNPGNEVEDWVKDLKPSSIIQGIIDTFASRETGGDATTNPCFLCLEIEERNPAFYHCEHCDIILCNKCVKMHRAGPATSSHTLSDLGTEAKPRRQRRLICKTHNSIMEFFCKACSKTVCQICMDTNHKTCHNIVPFESMVTEMKGVLREKKKVMIKEVKKIQSACAGKERKVKEVEKQKTLAHSEITNAVQRVINLIKQRKYELVGELEHLAVMETDNLKAQIKSGQIDIQMYGQHCDFITECLNSNFDVEIYYVYQMFQSEIITSPPDTDKVLKQSLESGKMTFLFQENPQQILYNNIHLGSIKVAKEDFC